MSKRIILLLVYFFFSFLAPVFAQEGGILPGETYHQPKEREVQVTASVKDDDPPSTPILIAPPNNSYVTTNKPTFIWKESTDDFSGNIDYYTLYLDGSIKFDNIPISDTDNSDYTLTFDSTTRYFSLTPKSNIADGVHTWKVTATDFYDNIATSVTWTFTIDSTAPTFVITQVENQTVSISAQDTSTVPDEPIVLEENEPILIGTGEANSTVKLTVTFADGSTDVYNFTIDGSGNWTVTLGILPRDEVIYLDFLITDLAGHISVLDNVPLTLPTPKIVIEVPFVPPAQPGEEPVIPPVIEIPIPPVKEVIKDVVDVITKPLPPGIKKLISSPYFYPTPYKPFSFFNILVLIIISSLPFLKTLLLAPLFGRDLSFAALHEIWKAIGLLPSGDPQGIVVNKNDQSPIQFTKLIFSGKHQDNSVTKQTKLTNKHGIYNHSNFDKGMYRVSTTDKNLLFPLPEQPPMHLSWNYFYKGDEFEIAQKGYEPALIIPVEVQKPPMASQRLKSWILNRTMASFKILILCLLVMMVFPSGFNIYGTIGYTLLLGLLKLSRKKIEVSGIVVNQEKLPLFNTILILLSEDQRKVEDIWQTSKRGEFYLHGSKNTAILTVIDFTYQLAEENSVFNSVDVRKKLHNNKAYLALIMLPIYAQCPVGLHK